jgi:regulator of RNase E activity RraA
MTPSASALDRLRAQRTPVVYDAIERFGVRPKNAGYTDASIRCMLPSLGSFVGYACTGKIICELPPVEGEQSVSWRDVWEYVSTSRNPSVAVVQDLDQPSGRGCAWGDVSATIFKSLGCTAVVTNGCVRDIREVEAIGFGLFASGPIVGHANARYVEIGTPVKIGGLVVQPGDLIHADEHGAMVIPAEIDLEELLRVIDHAVAAERQVIEFCRGPRFDLDELDRLHTWSMETAE